MATEETPTENHWIQEENSQSQAGFGVTQWKPSKQVLYRRWKTVLQGTVPMVKKQLKSEGTSTGMEGEWRIVGNNAALITAHIPTTHPGVSSWGGGLCPSRAAPPESYLFWTWDVVLTSGTPVPIPHP